MEGIEVSVRRKGLRPQVWRRGSGAPLLYLHDTLGPVTGAPFLESLARRFEVFAPIHPGFASADGANELETGLDFARHYQRLLEELGIERARVIGHSLGGMIAAELAALAPERVDRLVLVCPLGLWIEEVPVPDVFGFSARQLLRSALHDPDGSVGVELLRRFAVPDRALDALPQAAVLRKLLSTRPAGGFGQRIHDLQAPTLLVWGASDGLVPTPYGEAFRRAIPGAVLEIVNGAGHFPMLEQPNAFLERVMRFL